MIAKPIFIIRFPNNENMSYNSYKEHILSHDLINDYHVLLLRETNRDEVGFEVLNVSDHDPIRMEQLEKLVLDCFTEEHD